MIASILIIIFSLALFVYWFRYTCLLILSAKATKDYSREVATANQLSFLGVQEDLASPMSLAVLADLEKSLDRDYKILTSLLSHAPGFMAEGGAFEQRMLRIDYWVMKLWLAVARRLSPSQAASALREMAEIVAHFADTMGQASAVKVEA